LVHGLVVFSWYDVITCESSVHTFRRFFSTIFLFLTFLNIQIYFIILKTYDQQFTLTTKKSLHIIFKALEFMKLQRYGFNKKASLEHFFSHHTVHASLLYALARPSVICL